MNFRSLIVTGLAVAALGLSACGTKSTAKTKAGQNGQFGAYGQQWNNSGWNQNQWQQNGWNYNPGGQYGFYNYPAYSSLTGYWYAYAGGMPYYMYINGSGSMFWLGSSSMYTTGMVPYGYVWVNGGLSLNLNLNLGNPLCIFKKKHCCHKPVYQKPCCNHGCGGNPTDFPPPGGDNPTALAGMSGEGFDDGLSNNTRGSAGMRYDNYSDTLMVDGVRFSRLK